MMSEIYFVSMSGHVDDKLSATLFKVAHFFGPELALVKGVGIDGDDDEFGMGLMYFKIELNEYGEPAEGNFFDSLDRVIEYLADNQCTRVNGQQLLPELQSR